MRLVYLSGKTRELDRDRDGLGRVIDGGLEDVGAPLGLAGDVVERADAAGLGGDGKGLGDGGGGEKLRLLDVCL